MHTYRHIHTYNSPGNASAHVCVCAYVYTCVRTYVCGCACILICMYVQYMCLHVFINPITHFNYKAMLSISYFKTDHIDTYLFVLLDCLVPSYLSLKVLTYVVLFSS